MHKMELHETIQEAHEKNKSKTNSVYNFLIS